MRTFTSAALSLALALAIPRAGQPFHRQRRRAVRCAGCALCHTPTLQTGNNSVTALRQQNVNLYSGLAIHRMGQALADGITQGAALGDE